MSYIKYIQHQGKYDTIYENYLKNRLNILQSNFEKSLDDYYSTNQVLLTLNNTTSSMAITEEEIAEEVNKRLNINELYEDFTNIYSNIGKSLETVNSNLKQMKNQPGSIIYDIQNELIPNDKYSVKLVNMKNQLKNIPSFLIANAGQKNIYGPIGELGESTSSLAATAIGQFLIEKIENSIGEVSGVVIKRENKGTKKEGDYHLQTDNGFSYKFTLKNGNTVTTTINFSDKASAKQLQHFERKRTTGQVYLSRSNPAELAKELRDNQGKSLEQLNFFPLVYYNVISYHKYGKSKWSHLYNKYKAGKALRNYYGYKLMIRTFITSQQFEYINFTVMGNKIIPETNILKQLRELKNNTPKYSATIENWRLIHGGKDISASDAKSAVKDEAEAENVIDTMLVAIKTSFKF